jgi:heme/copper-type cytochrome/quinol oxidase subunit 4
MDICNIDQRTVFVLAAIVLVLIIIYFMKSKAREQQQLNNAINSSNQEEMMTRLQEQNKNSAKSNMICGIASGILVLTIAFYVGACMYGTTNVFIEI